MATRQPCGLLRPWLVLAPAVLVLSLVQGIAAHAPWAVLGQHAIADALMLLRAWPFVEAGARSSSACSSGT